MRTISNKKFWIYSCTGLTFLYSLNDLSLLFQGRHTVSIVTTSRRHKRVPIRRFLTNCTIMFHKHFLWIWKFYAWKASSNFNLVKIILTHVIKNLNSTMPYPNYFNIYYKGFCCSIVYVKFHCSFCFLIRFNAVKVLFVEEAEIVISRNCIIYIHAFLVSTCEN